MAPGRLGATTPGGAAVPLHGRMRELAHAGDRQLRTELEALGLTTVEV